MADMDAVQLCQRCVFVTNRHVDPLVHVKGHVVDVKEFKGHVWMLRGMVWTSRGMVWMLRAMVWMLRPAAASPGACDHQTCVDIYGKGYVPDVKGCVVDVKGRVKGYIVDIKAC